MGGILQVDSVLNNNTSNLITQTNSTTITIGSTGQTISLASGASSSGFGLSWNPTVQTTNFTASVGVGYMVNTTTAAITATLPAAPATRSAPRFTAPVTLFLILEMPVSIFCFSPTRFFND